MYIAQVVTKVHLGVKFDVAHGMGTDIVITHPLDIFIDMSPQLIAPFPRIHASRGRKSIASETKRTIARPNEGMTVRDYFAPPGDIALEMVLAMVFPLCHSEEIKTFVAVLQLSVFTAGGLAALLKPAVLNVIRPIRAFKTNE